MCVCLYVIWTPFHPYALHILYNQRLIGVKCGMKRHGKCVFFLLLFSKLYCTIIQHIYVHYTLFILDNSIEAKRIITQYIRTGLYKFEIVCLFVSSMSNVNMFNVNLGTSNRCHSMFVTNITLFETEIVLNILWILVDFKCYKTLKYISLLFL